jgi:hypothetical protein
MAYEASEIMLAAALLYSKDELSKYSEDVGSLRNLMVDSKEKILKSKNVEFGNSTIEKGFLDLMDPQKPEYLKDLVGGISAANAFREQVSHKNKTPTIYMTGNVWPKDVEKFRISAYGFDDYNSADVILTYDKKNFYGISLKKKRKQGAGEPTLINKAFDTILQGEQFDNVKDELAKIRINYFADLVIEAVGKGIINKKDIDNFDMLKKTDAGRKELFEAKKRNNKLFDRAYIDTKGSAKSLKGYKDDNTKNPNSMRYFVNKKLSEKDNVLWKQFMNVMNQYADLFADSLINVILKTKLFEELEAKDLKKYTFEFFLITGVGDITSKGQIQLGKANVIPLKTTLCGLTRVGEKVKNSRFEVVMDKNKKGQSDAAKIFLQLKKGNVTILDLQIRYKGAFTPQPQFQGTMNDQFKELLSKECDLK